MNIILFRRLPLQNEAQKFRIHLQFFLKKKKEWEIHEKLTEIQQLDTIVKILKKPFLSKFSVQMIFLVSLRIQLSGGVLS